LKKEDAPKKDIDKMNSKFQRQVHQDKEKYISDACGEIENDKAGREGQEIFSRE